MKKLLSILIFALVPMLMFAYEVTFRASSTVVGTGGTIGINASKANDGVDFGSEDTHDITKSGEDGFLGFWSTDATFYFHAKADEGHVFTGWYKNDIGTDLASADNPYSKKLSANSTGLLEERSAHYYAIFKQILKPAYKEVVLYLYDDGTLSAFPLSLTLNKTTALSITDNSNGLLSITQDGIPSGAEGQEIQLSITNATTAVGQFTEGEDLFTITLTPSNSSLTNTNTYNPKSITISVSIVKVATVSFTPPVAGGSFTYLQDNGSGKTISVDEEKTTLVKGEGNDKMFTLSATAATGYRFRRWVIDYTTGNDEYLYDQTVDHPIVKSASVTAEFISTDCAQFIVLPDTEKRYAHMDDAFDAAKKIGKTVVSVYQPGYITINTNGDGNATTFTKVMDKSEWILPRPTSGTYTIPTGYTLLVPGLERSSLTGSAGTTSITKNLGYTYLLGKSRESDYLETNPSPQSICKLVVESGTTLEVNGNLSVYSCLTSQQGYTGRPTGYGQVHLQNDSHIHVNNGATLQVMGYITGDPQESSVIARSGSKIYEAFQITDWRGGTAMISGSIVNNGKEVFPDGQYYLQNVETMLELEYGAEEFLTTAVDVMSPFPVTVEFVTKMTSGEDRGLFALGNGTKLQKYYDPSTDRLKVNFIGSGSSAQAELSYIHMDIVVPILGDYSLDSRRYVLPINNNIDVLVDNVSLYVPYKFAFMAGSSLTVTSTSQLNIQNEMFLYDKELNVQPADETKGYNGSNDVPLLPITYTAYHNKAPGLRVSEKTRYPENLSDATFIIDGTLTMEGNGALYTTTYNSAITGITRTSDEDLVRDFGANITSNGGGLINFKTVGSKTKTNQISQPGTTVNWVDNIPVCNAWLRNADGTREAGPSTQPNDTYMYVDGSWIVPTADLHNYTGNTFYTTLPKDITQDVICNVVANNVTVTGITFSQVVGSQFEKAGDCIFSDGKWTVPVRYKHTRVHNASGTPNTGSIEGIISYKDNANIPHTKTVSIPLTGTENYTPIFNVAIEGFSFSSSSTYPNLIVGTGVGESKDLSVVISPTGDNVTTLSTTQWNDPASATAAPFSFVYGSGDQKLSNAKLSYIPMEVNTHTGSLTITATYTDANDVKLSSTITIDLNAKVDYKKNTLKFADFPEKIYVETTDPFIMLDESTNNAQTKITWGVDKGGIVDIIGEGTPAKPYKVKPIKKGTVTITVNQVASSSVASTEITKTVTIYSTYDELVQLPFCMDGINTTFDDITAGANAITYNQENNAVDFTPSSSTEWQVQFKGIPSRLTFTPSGANTWRIREKSSSTAAWTTVVEWTNLASNVEVSYSLKPSTRFVQIQYSAQTEEVGSVTDLCVSQLDITASEDKLYVPVYVNSGEMSSKKVTFTHTSSTISKITLADPLTYTATTSENLGTIEEPYYTTVVTIQAPSTTEETTYSLVAEQGEKSSNVAIRTYKFPQELPIQLATDDVERYYFVTADSRYAIWNADSRQVVFQNPGAQLSRSITFAFNGAPSIIRFDLSKDVVDEHWIIEESTDGISFGMNQKGRDKDEGSTLTHQLYYTTRYVRVTYDAPLTTEIKLSNLLIEGYPQAIASPRSMFFTELSDIQEFSLTAINLQKVDFEVDNVDAFKISADATDDSSWGNVVHATETTHPHALGTNKVDLITISVKWLKTTALDEGKITIRNKADNSVLTTISLLGSDDYFVKDKAQNTGIYTGIPDGTVDPLRNYTYHGAPYNDYAYHQVDLTNAFAEDGTALFDYLFIYGETTPASGNNITAPQKGSADGSTNVGSNAVTPLIVYRKTINADDEYKGYQFVKKLDNVNVANKAEIGEIIINDTSGVRYINVQDADLRIYMTGFCPYATTGYDKLQEGVFLFRGKHGKKLDLYLEDLHVFSRNKTENGNAFYGDKEGGETYNEGYARGSGGVLVFENIDKQEELLLYEPFEVSIHTRGDNLLVSNHGCFFGLAVSGVTAMKAYQVSSPIQVHMHKKEYSRKTKTTLNFDDLWPTAVDASNAITSSTRTNGFLALKKQANNAPSIDLGNAYTEVNFKGGRVELQNSQIGSDTYKTTLAISYRAGFFGAEDAGIELCYGIGTDAVDGTVNFLDGTVTVDKMFVDEKYRQYYLMDDDGVHTSCLRTPQNTYVRGGSVCNVRACKHVTSKGGAPKDKSIGKLLGKYEYTLQDGVDSTDPVTGLASVAGFPNNIDGLQDYYEIHDYTYGLNSVTPDENNKLYFWLPEGYGNVTAEKDVFMSTWKACMTKIGAGIAGVAEGEVGGDTEITEDEEVKYFLYCQLDDNIYNVIRAREGEDGPYTYEAPIEVPAAAREYFNGDYTRWRPNFVGESKQHQVLSDATYTIANRVYYITTATADIWQTFTAPFDVANIYVVEPYSEAELEKVGSGNAKRQQILQEQARHNADFAAFFGVAMAMGTMKSFDDIYASYIKWAKLEDEELNLYNPEDSYSLRGMYELSPYVGDNWSTANFYLNQNTANWTLTDDGFGFDVNWNMLTPQDTLDGILLHKDGVYSLLFPYCVGCDMSLEERDYWDYWSGKFLIFESTDAPQTIKGRDFLDESMENNIFSQEVNSDEVVVTGNSTFANLDPAYENVYVYNTYAPALSSEGFDPIYEVDDEELKIIHPTTAFLFGNPPTDPTNNMPARRITRDGKIIYGDSNSGNQNGTSGGHIPTVGGGNDLFVTSIAGGINVAVAAPQLVRVLSSTGAVIYSGYVTTAVDIQLPTTGIYIVSGENEVQKILF